MNHSLYIDEMEYDIELLQSVSKSVDAPRLIIVSYQPNPLAQEILQTCIKAIQQYTIEPYELWIVDNNSPSEYIGWLRELSDVNVVLSHTEPIPPSRRKSPQLQKFLNRLRNKKENYGSYANAVALEIATHVINPESTYIMPLHMDTMPCHAGWLRFLRSKLNQNVVMAGVRMDTGRTSEGILHILGYIVDFQIFQQLGLNFLPALPAYDAGDRVTIGMREAGYRVYACRNTIWEPELIEIIAPDNPLRLLHVDRSFDDDGNVIFLHLGRGIKKSGIGHRSGASVQEWLYFAKNNR